jgi:hypothetical protein
MPVGTGAESERRRGRAGRGRGPARGPTRRGGAGAANAKCARASRDAGGVRNGAMCNVRHDMARMMRNNNNKRHWFIYIAIEPINVYSMLAELSIHYRRGPWTIHGTWHMHMGHGMLPSAAPPAPGARRWGGTDVRRAAGGRGVGVHSCPFRGPPQHRSREN